MPGRTASSTAGRIAIALVGCVGEAPDDDAGTEVCAQEASKADAASAPSISRVNLARTEGICALYLRRRRKRALTPRPRSPG